MDIRSGSRLWRFALPLVLLLPVTPGCGSGGADSACVEGATVAVPGGPFMMGCSETVDPTCEDQDCPEITCQEDEYPYREVTVPDFEIDQCEVSVASYTACVDAKACTEPSTYSANCNWGIQGREQHPINCLDWDQATAYCAWDGKRLCTESEWEKAARGGCELYADCKTESPGFPWTDGGASCGKAVYLGCNCTRNTCETGTLSAGASPYGALDMAGNVWEWIADTYHETYDGAPDDGTAWEGGTGRMYRGGGWISNATGLRVSNRVEYKADGLTDAMGFRCCK